MKKMFFLIVTFLVFSSSSFAQLAKDAWSFGFGGTYPRYVTSEVRPSEFSYGGFLFVQRHFNENVGLKISGKYNNLEGEYGSNSKVSTTLINLLFNVTYNLSPCSDVSPYIGIGVGPTFFKPSNAQDPAFNDKFMFDYVLNFNIGTEWKVGDNWKLITELSHYTPATSRIDGNASNSGYQGLLGGHYDTYMNFDLGLQYYFGKGEPSKICALYDGLVEATVDYSKIEDIVKKYAGQTQPADVDYNRIEDIVKKHKSTVVSEIEDKWVLIGVNFDFNKASLLPESYAVLYNAARVLLTNPDVKVEIQGHTDNIGSDAYNKKLSLQRAETVKNFLVSKGVAASRLTTVGVGSSKPVADNKTAEGRALNRRIEFQVKK